MHVVAAWKPNWGNRGSHGASQANAVAQANCCAGSVVDLMPYVKVSDRCAAH